MGQEKNRESSAPHAYQLIEEASELTAFALQARSARMLAVDLEADSMFHYREKVCLLQMAANGTTVVVDPLKVADLAALKPLFADEGILKVFHGADYDVRSLYRDFGISVNHLFDTQLASMYLGQSETSLEAVLNRRYGVVLDKKYQKKDWSRRPLPPEMVAYAAADVQYLVPLAQALMTELETKGRLAWVQEGCHLLSQVRPQENNLPMFLKFRGAGRLTPRQLAALEELLLLRDAIARQKDRPLFKIMNNADLLKIAMLLPSRPGAIEGVPGPERQANRNVRPERPGCRGPRRPSAQRPVAPLPAPALARGSRRAFPAVSSFCAPGGMRRLPAWPWSRPCC